PIDKIGLHMHDTYSNALENCAEGLKLGVEFFDASAGGTGGCPFAPGASGNLATGALFDLAQRNDCAPTQTSLTAIDAASDFLSSVLNKPLARGAKLCP
ncbi:MAG: hydroxymethylglutaryl-CoA lyase, partial [Planctomycetota bacterium]|nr:hydroxymethylglutaryl-CoA lyase [Planctomycetota bacterium]